MRKKTIRIISLILIGLLILGIIPAFAFASSDVASATVNGVTTGYASVQAAVDAAANGGTVTLLADVELEAPINITTGTVTIDLAGHQLANYVSGENNHVLYVQGGNLTVTDTSTAKTGTLTPNGSSIFNAGVHVESGSAIIKGVICNGGYCALSIDSGSLTIDDVTTDEDICINGGTVTVNGGNMEQLDMSGGDTTVNGGTFSTTSGTTYLIYLNGGNITVNGGIWKFCDNYGIRFNDGDSFCYIKGGVYTNGLKMSCAYGTGLDMYLPDILEPGYYLYDDSGNEISLSYNTKKVKGYVAVAQESPGARVFNVKYTLTGLTSSNTSTTLNKGFSLFVNLIPDEGYAAPETIRILMDGKILYSSKYSYSNGFLRLMSDQITGDLEIIATGVEAWTYSVEGLEGYAEKEMAKEEALYTKTFTSVPAADYEIFVKGSSISSSSQTPAVKFTVSEACDVTVTYDPETGDVTVTGDNVTQEVITHRVVYFDNSGKNWSNVNIYAWNESGSVAGTWPGTAMTKLDGTNIYYYVLPIEAVNVIFNDGSNQTGDLTIPDMSLNMFDASEQWVYYDGNVSVCNHPSHNIDGYCNECGVQVGHNYIDGECACGALEQDEPTTDRLIYFKNTSGWTTPYIYAWTTANGSTTNYVGSWPGAPMTKVEGEQDVYCYTIPYDAVNVIFHNNSGTQTNDLTLPTNSDDFYNYSNNSWSKYEKTPCTHPTHNQSGICGTCGEPVEHQYSSVVTPPSCTSDGYTTHTCSVCGHSYTDTPVTGGHSMTYTPGSPADCHNQGLLENWYCDVCKCYFTDALGNNAVDPANLVIPATTHDWKDNACLICGDAAIVITVQPQNVTVLPGQQARVTVEATGEELVYEWYYANKDKDTFSKTTAFATNAYYVSMNSSRDGRRVYCVITDKNGNSVTTDTATLTMDKTLQILQQPTDVTAASGETAKVTFKASGEGLTYKWYYANKGSDTFTLTTSFSTNSYSITMKNARDGRRVYCVVTDKYGNSVTTDTVTLSKYTPLEITRQPVSVKVAMGEQAKVTVTAKGDGLRYEWFYANAGEDGFVKTKSFTTNSYYISMTAARNGRQVYCVVSDKYGNSVTTEIVTLMMESQLKITCQPQDTGAIMGNQVRISLTANGEGLTYQWFYANAGEEEFKLTTAFGGPNYTVTLTESRVGRRVYCVITDKYGNQVISDIATICEIIP